MQKTTYKSANDWIDEHVILEAKALMKYANMTAQLINDALDFPTSRFLVNFSSGIREFLQENSGKNRHIICYFLIC